MGYWKDERARYYKLDNATEAPRVFCRGCGKSYKAFNSGWQIRHMERCDKLRDAALPSHPRPEPPPTVLDEPRTGCERDPICVLRDIVSTGEWTSPDAVIASHYAALSREEQRLREDSAWYDKWRHFPELLARRWGGRHDLVLVILADHRDSIAQYRQCIAYHHEQLRALEGDTTVIEAYRIIGA